MFNRRLRPESLKQRQNLLLLLRHLVDEELFELVVSLPFEGWLHVLLLLSLSPPFSIGLTKLAERRRLEGLIWCHLTWFRVWLGPAAVTHPRRADLATAPLGGGGGPPLGHLPLDVRGHATFEVLHRPVNSATSVADGKFRCMPDPSFVCVFGSAVRRDRGLLLFWMMIEQDRSGLWPAASLDYTGWT